jgi:site-specific DNA-methyltransferase (adenine-specific)
MNTHTVIHDDCLRALPTLEQGSISACITDPPYNYEFVGRNWDHKEIERRLDRAKNSTTLVKNLPYGSGLAGGVRNENWYKKVRENALEYERWCETWGSLVYRVLRPGAYIAVFNSTRTMATVQHALEAAGFYARDVLVYRRSSGIPKGLNLAAQLKRLGQADSESWTEWHSCLRGEWEAICLLQKPLATNYVNTFLEHGVGLMRAKNSDGSFQSNILEGYARTSEERFDVHCTVKPIALMEKLIDLLVPPGREHFVLDPFAGTGTTLVAAKNLGRPFIGVEIEGEYVSVINSRIDNSPQVRTEMPTRTETPTLFP